MSASATETLVAKRAAVTEAKEAARAARQEAKEAETAAKEERRKAREAKKAEKAALPKKPRGRPRKNPLPAASESGVTTDMDNMSAHSSIHYDADSDSEIAMLRAELSALKARHAALEIAYHKTAHTLEAIRSALTIAAL